MPDESGASYRQVLEGLISRTRKPDRRAEYERELACPLLPPALTYLWETFRRLRRRKGAAGFGPGPIEWPDIDAFCRLFRTALTPWEVELIEQLDELFLTAVAAKSSTKPPPTEER